jgi:hypothetical protein
MRHWIVAAILFFCATSASIPAHCRAESIRIDIARDTWVSNYDTEIHGSNGAANRLKLKSIQELSILDFQAGPLRGKKIVSAKLMLKIAGDEPIERVTVSTITCDWVEGTGKSYAIVKGASSFSHRIYPKERWNDSDLTAVCIGQGGSMYASIDAKPSKEAGWFELDVPPQIIEARVAGLSFGMVLMDDTGSTWKRNGEEFTRKLFPNRFVSSRDQNRASAPYLLVEIQPFEEGAANDIPEPSGIRILEPDMIDPRPRATWIVEPNQHDSVLGFKATADDSPVEQYLVPSLGSHHNGQFVMPLDTLTASLPVEQSLDLQIRTVARNGKLSKPASVRYTPSKKTTLPLELAPFAFSSAPVKAEAKWNRALSLGNAHWSVIDPLDTYLAKSKKLIPSQRESYLESNHLWDASTQTITLDGARAGWIGFQLVCDQAPNKLGLQWQLDIDAPNAPHRSKDAVDDTRQLSDLVRTEWSSYETVLNKEEPTPDPLVRIASGNERLDGTWKKASPGTGQSWLLECYVSEQIPAGNYDGRLVLTSDGKSLELKVKLRVHDVVLSKELSFLPEMNCYGLPENDLDYYRLGQRHRVVLNRVPYNQRGELAQHVSPVWREGVLDWAAFDKRYGGLFNGEAFADLPRGAVPIECFYFAMHENWPTTMDSSYNGSYWADQAFPAAYREAWVSSVAQAAEHVHDEGWSKTRFHVFLNNKLDFKDKGRGWSGGSSPWLLDEPANFQDYIALRYYGLAFRDGMHRARTSRKQQIPQVVFRCDISRPQWQRDTLDQLLGYNVVSQSSYRQYRRLVLDRKFRENQTVLIYGSNNPVGTNNAMAVAWSWDAWCLGTDGILPWQTIGTKRSWTKADELSLFYPHPTNDKQEPLPSIRLKAYCYGQQDAEVLAILAKKNQQDRYTFGEQLQKALKFKAQGKATEGAVEPASWNDYGNITSEMLHHWRIQWLKLAASKD